MAPARARLSAIRAHESVLRRTTTRRYGSEEQRSAGAAAVLVDIAEFASEKDTLDFISAFPRTDFRSRSPPHHRLHAGASTLIPGRRPILAGQACAPHRRSSCRPKVDAPTCLYASHQEVSTALSRWFLGPSSRDLASLSRRSLHKKSRTFADDVAGCRCRPRRIGAGPHRRNGNCTIPPRMPLPGPSLRGRVLPGGGDWTCSSSGRHSQLDFLRHKVETKADEHPR